VVGSWARVAPTGPTAPAGGESGAVRTGVQVGRQARDVDVADVDVADVDVADVVVADGVVVTVDRGA
jgi:hypothetical protein